MVGKSTSHDEMSDHVFVIRTLDEQNTSCPRRTEPSAEFDIQFGGSDDIIGVKGHTSFEISFDLLN